MTGEVVTGTARRKFIPLLRGHDWQSSAPIWLRGSFYIDLRGEPYAENSYQELLDTLLDRREDAPALGGSTRDEIAPRSAAQVDAPTKRSLTQSDDDSWPFIWKQLRDASPHDYELIAEGHFWLQRNPRSPSWAYVWEDLIRAESHSRELQELGLMWLQENVGHSGWPFVWRALTQIDPHSQELIAMGKHYLFRGK